MHAKAFLTPRVGPILVPSTFLLIQIEGMAGDDRRWFRFPSITTNSDAWFTLRSEVVQSLASYLIVGEVTR